MDTPPTHIASVPPVASAPPAPEPASPAQPRRRNIPRTLFLAGVAAVTAALAIALANWPDASSGPFHAPLKQFFLNETTGELVVRTTDEAPPLPDAHGHPTLVRAVCYTIDGGRTRTVAYLQRYSPAAQHAYRQIRTDPAAATSRELQRWLEEGTFVRAPQPGSPWVLLNSSAGTRIAAHAVAAYPRGATVREILPD